MTFEEAENILANIRALRASHAWAAFLLPEIERRMEEYQNTALLPVPACEAHAEARYRHAELSELLSFLDSAERNANERCRDEFL